MRLFAFISSIFAGLYLLCASDVTDLHPPWDAIKLVSFNQGSAEDRSWMAQTPTTSAGVTFPAGYRTADFDGTSNAVVSYPDNAEMETFPMSLSAWIRIDSYTGFRSIISKITQATNYIGWHFYYGPGVSRGLAFGHTNHTGLPVLTNFRQAWTASGTLSAGTWYHVGMTIDALGNVPLLYINGVSQSVTSTGLGTIASQANSDPMRLGGLGGPDFTQRHDGGLDDVRIYSRVLTANEIGAIYAEGIGASRP